MREALAERLLAEVMHWSAEDVAAEMPDLQALAAYKYDQYMQFSPGMHFIESLAIWLSNFKDANERVTAYKFVKDRLVFVSEAEMRQLVELSYSDFIRNILVKKVARDLGIPDYQIARIATSDEFERAERKSIFLGLSDGARVDFFRRIAGLSNEQVYATYQLSNEKAADMVKELNQDLIARFPDSQSKDSFNNLFLLDDFAGSGDSLLRKEDGEIKGKLTKCLRTLKESNSGTNLLDLDSLTVHVVLYMATHQAISSIEQRIESYWPADLPKCYVKAIYVLDDSVRVTGERDTEFDQLLKAYYDASIMDKHLSKGGDDVIHGYAECSLPLVLAHNAPNNSVYLIWANKPDLRTTALFPRVSRHREDL